MNHLERTQRKVEGYKFKPKYEKLLNDISGYISRLEETSINSKADALFILKEIYQRNEGGK